MRYPVRHAFTNKPPYRTALSLAFIDQTIHLFDQSFAYCFEAFSACLIQWDRPSNIHNEIESEVLTIISGIGIVDLRVLRDFA